MGCCGSNTGLEGVHKPIDSNMEEVGIESLDSFFKNAEEVCESIEEMREQIIDGMDEMLVQTGGIAHLDPTFEKGFWALCWKISADNKGKFVDAGYKLDTTNFDLTLTGKNNSPEAIKAFETMKTYVKDFVKLQDKGKELGEKVQKLVEDVSSNSEKYITEVKEKYSSDFLAAGKAALKLKDNLMNIKDAGAAAPKMVEFLASQLAFLKDTPKMVTDLDTLKKIDEVGDKANKAKKTDSVEIAWTYGFAPKERYGKTFKECLDRWDKKTGAKKTKKEEIKKKKESRGKSAKSNAKSDEGEKREENHEEKHGHHEDHEHHEQHEEKNEEKHEEMQEEKQENVAGDE